MSVACVSDEETSSGADDTAPSTTAVEPDPVVAWHVGSDWDADAIIEGRITIDGSCVLLRYDGVPESRAIVWPIGTTWDASSREIVTADGLRLGHGDRVVGSGGGVPLAQGAYNGLTPAELGAATYEVLESCVGRAETDQVALLDAAGRVESPES